ncbi:MAG: exodeoxyribonuclease VII large subunit [Bacilli bacterium]
MNNEYITISELTRYIKGIIDNNEFLNKVYIKGEISNFKNHTRGHYYFTLKDEKSRVNAVMFASSVKNIKFMPNDGMKVLVTGRISVYEATGGYQIYVDDMVKDGVGNLYVAFEQLKEKLGKEGLFDVAHKKKIRKVPRKIGIITASTGAAIKDILTTIKRRFPVCETILFPSLVQGEKAKEDIVRNIELANTYDLDTLIVGRGGGSIEDLWPFNEEIVARAIYNSKIPVISAVGHEIDYTIADFVADLRAPTPTAAAELAVPDITTILSYLDTAKVRSSNAISNLCDSKRMLLNKLEDSYILKRPMAIYEAKEQKLDNLIDNLRNAINKKIEIKKVKLFELTNSYVFYNPDIVFGVKRNNLENVIHKLEILNPLNTLKRGYTITRFNDKIITNASIVKKDDIITVEFVDGVVKSKILEVDK